MRSTTSRTKVLFEKEGYIVASVEKWNAHVGPLVPDDPIMCPECGTEIEQFRKAGIRQDLFGFADLIAFHPEKPGIILIQSTSGGEHARRVAKIHGVDVARKWVKDPIRQIAVVSWSKRKQKLKKGWSKKSFWSPRIEFITEIDFGKLPF
jgi:hypothetical protein